MTTIRKTDLVKIPKIDNLTSPTLGAALLVNNKYHDDNKLRQNYFLYFEFTTWNCQDGLLLFCFYCWDNSCNALS